VQGCGCIEHVLTCYLMYVLMCLQLIPLPHSFMVSVLSLVDLSV